MRIWKPKFERRKCFGPSHMQGVADRWHSRKQPLWKRLASGLHVPRFLQMQSLGFPCCCEDCTCVLCTPGGAPCKIEVTFTGIIDDDCSDCDPTFNDTFTLDITARDTYGIWETRYIDQWDACALSQYNGTNLCVWQYDGDTTCSDSGNTFYIRAVASPTGLGLNVNLYTSNATDEAWAIWRLNTGMPTPGCVMSDVDIPYEGQCFASSPPTNTPCDMSSSTCTLSTL